MKYNSMLILQNLLTFFFSKEYSFWFDFVFFNLLYLVVRYFLQYKCDVHCLVNFVFSALWAKDKFPINERNSTN